MCPESQPVSWRMGGEATPCSSPLEVSGVPPIWPEMVQCWCAPSLHQTPAERHKLCYSSIVILESRLLIVIIVLLA